MKKVPLTAAIPFLAHPFCGVALHERKEGIFVRTLTTVLVISLLVAACSSSDDSTDSGSESQQAASTSDLDPCALMDAETLSAYFGSDVPPAETATNGPIEVCKWSDANASSVSVQTARDYALHRLDGCDECVDLSYGDDGYAAPGIIQSTAKFVVGDMWYSVTTTGFGDDAEAIATLGETVLANAAK
ncbi:MAG: hypothetical protein ACR2NG_06220 [Acidimicrobiia bacterium]